MRIQFNQSAILFLFSFSHVVITKKTSPICPTKPLKATGEWKTITRPAVIPVQFQCQIVITSAKNVELEFNDDFNLVASAGCDLQKMEIYDGKISDQTMSTRLCGNARPHRITSTSKKYIIKFSSNLRPEERWMNNQVKYAIKYRSNYGWDDIKSGKKNGGKKAGKKSGKVSYKPIAFKPMQPTNKPVKMIENEERFHEPEDPKLDKKKAVKRMGIVLVIGFVGIVGFMLYRMNKKV